MKTYYKVIPLRNSYRWEVQMWRWWWPFWCYVGIYDSEKQAADFIKGHSTYYDGAE